MAAPAAFPPTLDLGGAVLRPLRASDADALLAYLEDPAVTERTSYPAVSRALVEGMIERSNARWAAGEPSRWGLALAEGDRVVGTCGFNDWSRAHRRAEMAFDLARDQWGKGWMGRAAAAALDWAWGEGLVHRVEAFVRVDNERSARVLERSGFAREGCLRGYRVCRGEPHDYFVFGLLRADWEAARAQGARG